MRIVDTLVLFVLVASITLGMVGAMIGKEDKDAGKETTGHIIYGTMACLVLAVASFSWLPFRIWS